MREVDKGKYMGMRICLFVVYFVKFYLFKCKQRMRVPRNYQLRRESEYALEQLC
jgi:hypothetical protein